MNRYGQMVLEFNRLHRPAAFAQISDPGTFFETAGEEIEVAITAARDEIVGPQRSDESADAYRRRSYQALRTAEEAVLADHWLMVPEFDQSPDPGDEDDPSLTEYYRDLEEIDRARVEMHQILANSDSDG